MKKLMILFLVILAIVLVTVPAWAETAEMPATSMIPIDLTPLFQVVLTTLITIITAKVIPWIKARATAEQQIALNLATRTIVYAAEQIYRNEKESGNEKLKYVQNKLREKGFDVDIDAIEAAVMEMKLEEVGTIEVATETELGDDSTTNNG